MERLGSRRRITYSRLKVAYVVSYIRLNYKVSFFMSINSLRKKNYNIVYSLCSLQSVEARPSLEPLKVLPRAREERHISRMLLRV
jgi:hypothetical protein